jgi:glycosyltransferase involved in cell wall biosynthesis
MRDNSAINQTISLIIPVYNEAVHLERFLSIIDELALPVEKELIIVNDCSTDGSAGIIKQFKFKSPVILIEQHPNQGKGAAIRAGIQRATGTIIGIQDADMETDPSEISRIVMPLLQDKADVVYGSRFKKTNDQVHRTFHYLVNRLLTMLSNVLSNLYLTDMETCYKFFRADLLKNIELESNRFGFEPEVTAKIARLQIRIMELPISYYPRKYLEGKKLNWKDGIAAVGHIVRFNLIKGRAGCFHETLPERYLPKGGNWL